MKTVVLVVALLAASARADEFRAVVVSDQESSALRAAKARAVEAEAAFTKLRAATEERYKSRFRGCCVFDWSDDYRVIVERTWAAPSNLQWLQPQPLYQPGGWGSITIPTTTVRLTWPSGELFQKNAIPNGSTFDWGDAGVRFYTGPLEGK